MTIDELIAELNELKESYGPDTQVVIQSGYAGRKTTYSDFMVRPISVVNRASGDYMSDKSRDSFMALTFDLILPF